MGLRAQVSLTPAESKKLISEALLEMEIVKNALENGLLVIDQSTTTSFLIEKITGKLSEKFVCGVIVPKGTCGKSESLAKILQGWPRSVATHPNLIVVRNGKEEPCPKLSALFNQMEPDDVFIKGANALDPQGNAGVLVGNLAGLSIGSVYVASKTRGFKLIIPVGLEKLIPISVRDASMEAGIKRYDYAMGMPCALLPIDGIVVTELEAIKILTGATAVPISAGGVAGAEGAVTLIIKGDEIQFEKAIKIIESIKGTKLPKIVPGDCLTCTFPTCRFKGTKH